MIDGNLAYKADVLPAVEPCEGASCQWPAGCHGSTADSGHYRLVAMPDGSRLWLCRVHAARSAKEKVAVLATQTRPARDEARAELARRQAAKEEFAVLASRNRAEIARRQAADSPAPAPSKPRVDDEASRPVVLHRLRSLGAGIGRLLLQLAALVWLTWPLWLWLLL